MTRYRMTGRLNIPHDVLTDRSVGEVFDADLDADYAQTLVDAGALEPFGEAVYAEAAEEVENERVSEPEPVAVEPELGADAGSGVADGWEDDGGKPVEAEDGNSDPEA